MSLPVMPTGKAGARESPGDRIPPSGGGAAKHLGRGPPRRGRGSGLSDQPAWTGAALAIQDGAGSATAMLLTPISKARVTAQAAVKEARREVVLVVMAQAS